MVSEIIRYAVFGVFVLASAASLGSWAVRTRRISPFSRSARVIRRTTDPVLQPIERWLFKRGGNPQQAEAWLFGGAVVGGILVMAVAGFVGDQLAVLGRGVRGGPFSAVRLALVVAGQVLTIAILVRVIASWFGAGRFNRFLRPFYFLTDWIVEPLRKVVPPVGMFDFSPWIAFILIRVGVALIS